MKGDAIRQKFLDFFQKKGHLHRPSAPLAIEDPQLLFTIAGMVPFKAFFLGLEKPPATRITSCQLCFRTNDLERVGETSYHHTFFEMLGNFSFGDYFKKEASEWALEFVTRELDINIKRIWITIFKEDEETFSIWRKLGIPSSRIIRKGKEDNFWSAAETGPCGPDTELFFDRGENTGCAGGVCEPGCNRCSRWVEIWNLVFMQYNRDKDGNLTALPAKNVDTGMGLERVATVLQGVEDDYHTDLFVSLYNWLKEIAPVEDPDVKTLRVISDHLRGLTFLIAEGIFPSNTGRGYVVRRVLRRAFRYGRKLGLNEPFLYRGVPVVIKMMGGYYSHLEAEREKIAKKIREEEENFQETLTRGLNILEQLIEKYGSKKEKILPGEDIFRMYDTYGFPFDLTREIALESGLSVDEDGFFKLMEKQRQKSRIVLGERKFDFIDQEGVSLLNKLEKEYLTEKKKVFPGYQRLSVEATILAIVSKNKLVEEVKENEEADFILSATCFYPEGGGQIGDKGEIFSDKAKAQVIDTQKKGALIFHRVRVLSGKFSKGERIKAKVDQQRRAAISRAHTGTHLLQAALRQFLGEEVRQNGSLVEVDRLRFDFTFSSPVKEDILEKVCFLINEKIRENIPVKVQEVELEEAKKRGALTFFEEKYADRVRLVEIGTFSKEVCGGTHLSQTGEMGLFQIVSESGVASGIRRIEAYTGERALLWLMNKKNTLNEIAKFLEVSEDKIFDKLKEQDRKISQMEKRLEKFQKVITEKTVQQLVSQIIQVEGINLCLGNLDEASPKILREAAETIKKKLNQAVICLTSSAKEKAFIVVVSTYENLPANDLIKRLASLAGGSGGGRRDFAQGGTSHPEKIKDMLKKIPEIVQKMLIKPE